MSAAPRFPRDIGFAGLRMTANEFLALGETAEKYELIDGVVVMSPSPTPAHSEMLLELAFQLKLFSRTNPGVRVLSETDLRVSASCIYQPDLFVYAPGRVDKLTHPLNVPPDLIVEFLSPSTKAIDLITKRDDYERLGVAEYWVIEPRDATLRAWSRSGNQLLQAGVSGNQHASTSLPGFTADLAALRRFANAE
jgi:Uma2 family endonuclease